MAVDITARKSILSHLNRRSAARMPSVGSLRDVLHSAYARNISHGHNHRCSIDEAAYFLTAAVEMWQRAIHSLIVSVSLTDKSPIWACVSAYYSSHYVMRAVSHLNGWVCMKSPAAVLELSHHSGSGFFISKVPGNSEEHKFYWRMAADIFPKQEPLFDKDNLDSGQRHGVQYWDHIGQFKKMDFQLQNEKSVREDIEHLASSRPAEIPEFAARPQVRQLQINALHRINFLRLQFESECAGSSRFWNSHREPSWCAKLISYPEPVTSLTDAEIETS